MQGLKNILKEKPQIEVVYFNEKGEWLFFPNPNFPHELSREEVLSLPEEAEEKEADNANFLIDTETVNEGIKAAVDQIKAELEEKEKALEAAEARVAELEKQIGELPEGAHPDERLPRAESFLQERANWQSEVDRLSKYGADVSEALKAKEAENTTLKAKVAELEKKVPKK